MPLVRSTENLVSLESEEEIGICLICNVTIASADLHETGCKHSFHVACIQNWLRTDSNCPTCSKSIGSQSDPGASSNSHRMTTRSNSRALMANANANQQDSQSIPQQRADQVTSQNSSDVDESRIQQLISRAFERFHAQLSMDITNQITEAFQQLNGSTMGANNQRVGHQVQGNGSAHPSNPVGSEGTPTSGRSGRSPHSDLSIDRPDKISNTISNWRIKFSGSPSDITIEDFIYRVNCLTQQSLDGNFIVLCQFANLLFTGSALSFYWRVHKSVVSLNWSILCRHLRERYQDQRSDREIRNIMRRRKQGHNESFDEFVDAMLLIADSLQEPMHDADLTAEVRHNLKQELKLELLHLETPILASLRKECYRHEEFYRSNRTKTVNRFNPPKRVNAIECENNDEEHSVDDNSTVDKVCAIKVAEKLTCWNCDAKGHRYHDCRKPRRIFCYGCGTPDTYKPDCAKCASASENSKADVRLVSKRDIRH
ncbi:uncharacterized protein LOC108099331 [Drosophila ficusphila]|uniref:uncharacterized protein LOC108099331 n=1 Tax=Drosophila ficusphila TaxID=30025 RepID=UPI001C88FD4D|nr:uncharacterized protein LOC108099331 [Drosophila ficusphila]